MSILYRMKIPSITAQGLHEPLSLRGSTLGTRAAEHKGCNWGIQIDWWLQPCAVFGHSFSGISWRRNEVNSIAWLYRRAQPKIVFITLHYTLHYIQFTLNINETSKMRISDGFIQVSTDVDTATSNTLVTLVSDTENLVSSGNYTGTKIPWLHSMVNILRIVFWDV